MSEYIKDPKLQIQALIGIANCYKKIQMFEYAINCLKYALIFVWSLDNEELELTIYEILGKLFFNLGYTDSAKILHIRAT